MRRTKKPGSKMAMKLGKERYKKEREAHRAKILRGTTNTEECQNDTEVT